MTILDGLKHRFGPMVSGAACGPSLTCFVELAGLLQPARPLRTFQCTSSLENASADGWRPGNNTARILTACVHPSRYAHEQQFDNVAAFGSDILALAKESHCRTA